MSKRHRVAVKRYDPTPKSNEFRLECLTAFYAGESYDKIAARLPVSKASIRNWRKDYPELDQEAQVAAADRRAFWAAAKESNLRQAALERQAYLGGLAAENAPLLEAMDFRSRAICEGMFAGATLTDFAARFGISRERVRQILLTWRGYGFRLPDARPFTADEQRLLEIYIPKRKKTPIQAHEDRRLAEEARFTAFPCYAQLDEWTHPAGRKKYTWKSEETRAIRVEASRRSALARYGNPALTSA